MPFRNRESYFSTAPQVSMQRSIIPRPTTHKTSFNFGECIPLYVDTDILPGDTVQMSMSKIVRLQTMLTPVLDDMYFDTYWFFVPHRLVWEHFKEMMKENNSSHWIQPVDYVVPSISAPSSGFNTGTLADYFGWPIGVAWSATDPGAPTVLAPRAYALIMQDWFRSEVVSDPLNIPVTDSNQTGSNGGSYINDVANAGKPFLAAKFFDYFTSCVLTPQKGNAVTFPLLSGTKAPVYPTDEKIPAPGSLNGYNTLVNGPISGALWQSSGAYFNRVTGSAGGNVALGSPVSFDTASPATSSGLRPANLWADLSSNVGAVTVNELRLAFQLQKFYERLASAGSRYTETIRAFFSVVSPDARQQRPEYLGGNRITINVHEVTNNYQEASATPTVWLGDLGAKSVSADVHDDFIHSFTEHGTLMCIGVARYTHSYMGLEKMYTRKTFLDFYWPTFASLGYQPVKNYEIYPSATTMADDSVFGYNEAWSDYRYKPSKITGEMRPGISNTLASWHLGDYYTSTPTLSDGWIREDKNIVDRTLAVGSSVSNQLFGDFFFDSKYTRVMPVHSIPGLIDHF